MKTTLLCHSHVSRSAGGTAAISTTQVLILPVLGWSLGRRIVINHSRPNLPVPGPKNGYKSFPDLFFPRWCSLRLRVHWRSTTPKPSSKPNIFLNHDWWHAMNEYMKWHEVGGGEIESAHCWWGEKWERENPEKNPKNPNVEHHNREYEWKNVIA